MSKPSKTGSFQIQMTDERVKKDFIPQLRLLKAQKSELELLNFNQSDKKVRDEMIDRQIALIAEYDEMIKTLEGLINAK